MVAVLPCIPLLSPFSMLEVLVLECFCWEATVLPAIVELTGVLLVACFGSVGGGGECLSLLGPVTFSVGLGASSGFAVGSD